MSSGAVVFVMGPAGSGKSSFCTAMLRHCEAAGRPTHLFNLDPAAEKFDFEPTKDIRELISVDEAMEELGHGPNGGLVFCLEYLLDNIEWLEDDLGEYRDEFIIVDCPGQIELYTHFDIMPRIIECFQRQDYRVCGLYLLESQFLDDITKYFAGVLNATSAMLKLGIPHVNVISKMDLLSADRSAQDADGLESDEDVDDEAHELHRYFHPDPTLLREHLAAHTRPKFYRLNEALVQLIDEFDIVKFVPLNIKKESSLAKILQHIDVTTQYAEQLEPKEPKEFDDGDGDGSFEAD